MKRLGIFIVVCLLACANWLPASAFALMYENYQTYGVTEAERNDFLDGVSMIRMDTEMTGRVISNFAISEQGQIALYIEGEYSAVNIYDSNGVFQYSLRFQNGGSATVIFFEKENLAIYWGKERYISSHDDEGSCLSFQKVAQTEENADSYNANRFPPTSGQIGSIKYYAKRAGINPTYSKFSIEDDTGTGIVVYDATRAIGAKRIAICVFAVVGVIFVLAVRKYHLEETPRLSDT